MEKRDERLKLQGLFQLDPQRLGGIALVCETCTTAFLEVEKEEEGTGGGAGRKEDREDERTQKCLLLIQ